METSNDASRLLKATEELVTQARLDQIAKEHKSVGSILDLRKIQPLAEIKFLSKKSIKIDIEKRLNGRRGGQSEDDIQSATNHVVEKFKEKGISVESLSGNYDLEIKIWKEKAQKLSYTQRRRFQQPLLHHFYQQMDEKQKREFREKVSATLIQLAEKYRKECRDMKREFDASGIFHPEANAHRAHCAYLTKLDKGITCENLEDSVLRKMYLEFLREEKVRTGILSPAQTAFFEEYDPDTRAEKVKVMLENRMLQSLQSRNRSTLNKLKPLPSSIGKFSRTKSLLKFQSSSNEDDRSVGKDSTGSGAIYQKEKVEGVSPMKIFSKKLKHEKMGYMESRQVLSDEALRLDRGEEVEYRKARDKSDLLDEKLSSWMINELQDSEISKTAIGKTSATNVHSVHVGNLVPLASAAVAGSATVVNFDSLLSPSDYSATKVLPFSEFLDVIQSYQDKQVEYERTLQQSTRTQSGSPGKHQNKSFQSPKKPSRLAFDDLPTAPSAGGLEQYSPSFHLQIVRDTTASSALPEGASSSSALLREPSVAKINMIQHLQQSDDQFGAYLKLAQGEQFSNKLLSRLSSNLAKPRKPRRVAPLGKDAMSLTDSFGRAAKIASKGFQNIFAVPREPKESSSSVKRSQEDKEVDEEMEEKESDILTRLQGRSGKGDTDHSNLSKEESSTDQRNELNRNGSYRWKTSRSKSSLRVRHSGARPEDLDDFIGVYGFFHDDVPKLPDEMECDMQSKLVAIWDSLCLGTQERLTFMEKYSSSLVAAEMGHAIDLWGEVTVIFLLLRESLAVQQKTNDGTIILPIHLHDFLPLLTKKLHPMLTSTSQVLVPLSNSLEVRSKRKPAQTAKQFPLSSLAVAQTRNSIIQYFEITTSTDDLLEEGEKKDFNLLHDMSDLKEMLDAMISNLSKMLIDKLRKVQIELEDTIPFRDKPLREWLTVHGLYNLHHSPSK